MSVEPGLLDANVLAYAINADAPQHDASRALLEVARDPSVTLYVSSQILCDAARMTGGAWSSQGIIVFGPDYQSALFQVPATGGEPKPVTVKDPARGDNQHVSPAFLPSGKHFLFRITPNKGVWVGSLDSKEVKQVLTGNTNAAYAPRQVQLGLKFVF